MMSLDWNRLADAIGHATGSAFHIDRATGVGGGCIHQARMLLGTDGRRFFIKFNGPSHAEAFACEADALEAIAATRTIRVPMPILHGVIGDHAFLVLEAIDFDAATADWPLMGRQLADLHRHTSPTFGWHRDNWIGSSPQLNRPSSNWASFFRECRLAPQMRLAERQGFPVFEAQQLLQRVPHLLHDHSPTPALVHGDLWCGNVGFSAGQPVFFDPAIHFADREADLAMARLFGGFPAAFFEAYASAWPLPAGAATRVDLYQLYHLLNHANLFGGTYRQQAHALVQSLLRH